MAKLVFGLNQSLDGYVEHTNFLPSPGLFRHFIENVRGLAGMVEFIHRIILREVPSPTFSVDCLLR